MGGGSEKHVQRAGEVRASSRLSIRFQYKTLRPFDVESFSGSRLRFCSQESGILFDCAGLLVVRSLVHSSRPMARVIFAAAMVLLLAGSLWAQEETSENPMTGTIQGTLLDEDGNGVVGAKVFYISPDTETRGIHALGEGRQVCFRVVAAGPLRGASRRPEHAAGREPRDGGGGDGGEGGFQAGIYQSGTGAVGESVQRRSIRHAAHQRAQLFESGALEPGVQVVDGAVYDPGKSGFQSLSIDSLLGRTTHYDMDEVEVMDETKGRGHAEPAGRGGE
jgi:hypothetical protein